MLNKQYRLKSNRAFLATYRQNRVVSDKNLILYGGKNKEIDKNYPTRVGFVVSKKFHKRAVKRNRAKRLMREAFRLVQKNKDFKGWENFTSLIFIARNNALNADFEQIFSSVTKLSADLARKIF